MNLSAVEFAKSFGEVESNLPANVIQLIEAERLTLTPLIPSERDLLILEIIERIRNDKQIIAAKERTTAWEKGWAENLDLFRKNPSSDESLIPRFVRPRMPVRWFGEYFKSNHENFELAYIKILREYVISKYFNNVETLYEFGAGTGFNLLQASKIFPNLKLIGTDFVQPAVDLINEIGVARNINLTGSLFNMLTPSHDTLKVRPLSGIWTFGSLEQLGGEIKSMVDYLVESKPLICVHIEPVVEFYEENLLSDYLARWFQSQRGYTAGLVGLLAEYETLGKIKLLKTQRLNFGSLMMEGYNLIAWKPN